MENQQPPGFLYILISPENESIEKNPCSKTDVDVGQSKTQFSDTSMAAASACPRKRMCWDHSLKLRLYDDPWKIKKVLKKSDIGGSTRLLLPMEAVEEMILSVLGADARVKVASEGGIPVNFWDVNTESQHQLILKQWYSVESYVLIGSWNREFVKRRSLEIGDEIGLHWDPYKRRFNFSVLKRFC